MKEKFFKKFDGLFSLFSIQALACSKINKFIGLSLFVDTFDYFKEGFLYACIYQSDIDRIRFYVMDMIKKDSKYLDKLLNISLNNFSNFKSNHDKRRIEVQKISNINELKHWIKDFVEFASDTNAPAFLAEIFAGYDDYWQKYLGLDKDDFNLLMTPEEASYSKLFNYELAKIKTNKSSKNFIKLAEEFYWILNSYKSVNLVTPEYISKEFDQMTPRDAQSIIEDFDNYQSDLSRRKQEVYKRVDLNNDKKDLLKSLCSFVVLQDKRKEIISKTSSIFMFACNKLLDIYDLSGEEKEKIIESAFASWYGELDVKDLRERCKKAYILNYYSMSGKEAVGDEAQKIVSAQSDNEGGEKNQAETSFIKGRTAFGGLIRGRIKVIIRENDFPKFKDGEVLVTHMTRPEFVPLIKKASAIITDEGGITCHAAIVSRELKKPCIIGTKHATQVLKDGDMVEVDANKGIVRILKS
jgi:phosphohistidine swiveling domain-containing protein